MCSPSSTIPVMTYLAHSTRGCGTMPPCGTFRGLADAPSLPSLLDSDGAAADGSLSEAGWGGSISVPTTSMRHCAAPTHPRYMRCSACAAASMAALTSPTAASVATSMRAW